MFDESALYEIATAIDRLTLTIGHALYLNSNREHLEKRWDQVHDEFDGSGIQSTIWTTMQDAEEAIYKRGSYGAGGNIAKFVGEKYQR